MVVLSPAPCLVVRSPHAHKCRARTFVSEKQASDKQPAAVLFNGHDVQALALESDEEALGLARQFREDDAARRYVSVVFACSRQSEMRDIVQAVTAMYEAYGDSTKSCKISLYGAEFRATKAALLGALPAHVLLSSREHDFVIFVETLDHQKNGGDGPILLGSCAASEEFAVDAHVLRSKKNPGHICRAYFKLHEAALRWPCTFKLGPGLRVLDVGCAPGGWLELCAERKCDVIVGVDPGEVDSSLNARAFDGAAGNSVVHHVKSKLEDASLALETLGPFDSVIWDANMHPLAALRLLEDSASAHLKPGASLILTLKQPNGKSAKLTNALLDEVRSELPKLNFKMVEIAWLWANGRHEQTLCATFIDNNYQKQPRTPITLEDQYIAACTAKEQQ